MNRFTTSLVVIAAPFFGFSSMASAQAIPGFNLTAVAAACQQATTGCETLIANAISALQSAGLDDTAYASALASLAGAVLSAAQDNPGAAAAYADLMGDVAAAARDPDQASAIEGVAQLIEDGDADDVDSDIFDASPA
ncbi:MAG: hypothetical protein GY945_08670 [Rhodobacteraceae bacterium]|nr:hypothetical protein [Paracoccaceae bacterium]